jgi:ornithine cyclodeaminase/alanine dehydrogenase-like protein (mu-crystallin family)
MQVLIVNQREVHELLPMDECIEVMADALAALARGDALLPVRSSMALPDAAGFLLTMPALLTRQHALGLKVLTVFPGNGGTPFAAHQGVVLLFEPEHGNLRAILDAGEITAIRTAAVSGLATRLLAREDAVELAILGSGAQAHAHLQAMGLVRPLHRVRVWSRNPAHARVFAEREAVGRPFPIETAATADEAVLDAGIICTVTSSTEPVLRGASVAAGTHINAVGASRPNARELDTTAVSAARLFVDQREAALREAGDFLIPRQEGAIGDEHIRGELGELVLNPALGRQSAGEITLFKSLGLAVEDTAAAQYVYSRALQRGAGTLVELGQ